MNNSQLDGLDWIGWMDISKNTTTTRAPSGANKVKAEGTPEKFGSLNFWSIIKEIKI